MQVQSADAAMVLSVIIGVVLAFTIHQNIKAGVILYMVYTL